jgi:predicted alpha/beta-hydrolase family hydrolase
LFDELSIATDQGDVAALVHVPAGAQWLYVLAHGAGAGMRHRFMGAVAKRLAERSIATLRYEYRYMTAGSKRPEPAPRLEACTRAVADHAARELAGLRLLAGGKSMGGRITSQAQAAAPLARVERLVFLGFPLHGMGKQPNTARAAHLADVHIPMLILHGTRDTLADLTLMRGVCDGLGERAALHVVEGADHSFGVPKRSGRTNEQALDEIADAIAARLS